LIFLTEISKIQIPQLQKISNSYFGYELGYRVGFNFVRFDHHQVGIILIK